MLRVDKLTRVLLPVSLDCPDRPGRDAGDDRVVGDVMRYDGAGANDAVLADTHARHNHGVHSDVRVVADGNATEPIDVGQLGVHVPQRPGAAVMGRDPDSARDPDVVADCHKVRFGAEVKSIENLTPPPDCEAAPFQSLQLHPGGHEAPNDAIDYGHQNLRICAIPFRLHTTRINSCECIS